jgi:hypothetical protein
MEVRQVSKVHAPSMEGACDEGVTFSPRRSIFDRYRFGIAAEIALRW